MFDIATFKPIMIQNTIDEIKLAKIIETTIPYNEIRVAKTVGSLVLIYSL